MSATIPEPQHLWGRDFDEVLGDNPTGALDRIVRRILADVPDMTVSELDRVTAAAVKAGRAAILDAIATETTRTPPGPSAMMANEPVFRPGDWPAHACLDLERGKPVD